MADAEVAPRKRLIIKLRLPRLRTVSFEECKLKDDADSCSGKRKKDQHCSTRDEYSCNVVGKSDAKVSRTLSTEAECKQKKDDDGAGHSHGGRKRRKLATSEVSVSKKHDSKNMKKEEEIVPNEERMDRYQKMQCWVILKRFMVGRNGWAFKKPLDPKNLGILGNTEKGLLKPIGFEEIESKLNKFMYSGPDEFANDMKLLFSYGMMYPQREHIHRLAIRFSQSFEITWKALKEKWSKESKQNKSSKGNNRRWKKAT